ncbi:hypothetical protein D3C73_507260 [compost metagenome]
MLGGEEGGRGDPLVVVRRHMRQGRAQHGAADAVADGVQMRLAGLFERLLDRAIDALLHVVVEAELGLVPVRVDPGADEDGEPLRAQPADQGVRRLQVQDVEFVDPRREDQQRDRVLRVRGRVVLDQLEQLVAPDDLARRRGDVLAQDEAAVVGLADLQLARPALQVGGEVLHPAHQGFAAGLGQRLQRHGVRRQEVGGREGVGQQAGEELGPALHARVDVLDAGDQAVHPVRGGQVGLAHQVEHGVVRPGRVAEPLVGRSGTVDRLAHRPAGRRGPQIHVAAEQVGLGLKQLFGAGGQAGHDGVHGRGHVERIGRQGGGAVGLRQGRLGHRRLGHHRRLGQVERQGLQLLALLGAEGHEVRALGVGGGGGGGLRRCFRRGRRLRRFGRHCLRARLGRGGASGLARRGRWRERVLERGLGRALGHARRTSDRGRALSRAFLPKR